MAKIINVKGRQVFDSRGNPTVEAEVFLDNSISATAISPSGASTGAFEAHELRDKDQNKFLGKSVNMAVNNINDKISAKLKNLDPDQQENIDKVFTLMIVGGSQGAKIFDEIIHESIVKISQTNPIKIIHQTNKKNIDFLRNFYLENKIENMVFDFDQNLDLLLDQSDLCITRAGASSLAEIAILNIPFIAIPLP